MARRPGVFDAETFPERFQTEAQLKAAGDYFSKHPGLGESLIPVWGSGREAIADLYDGDYLGAAGNAVLAVADVIPAAAGARTAARSAAYARRFAGKNADWKAVRKWMGEQGYLEKGQPGHHWMVEKNSAVGKHLPNFVKNGPWNIKGMPDARTHGLIHHRWKDTDQYGRVKRTLTGTPTGVTVAVPTDVVKYGLSEKRKSDERK